MLAALFVLPAAAQAATTIGSDLQAEPTGETCGAVAECTAYEFAVDSIPIYGVIVSWSIRTDNPVPTEARLHLLGGSNFTGVVGETVEIPAGPRLTESPTRIPVVAVKYFALDGGGKVLAAAEGAETTVWKNAGQGGLGLEESRFPDEFRKGLEPLLSISVEPDKDGDGYGDETQDACPSDKADHEVGTCAYACLMSAPAQQANVCGPCCGSGIRPAPPRCKRGYVVRQIRGKKRCVKHRKHPHHHRRTR